MKKLYKNALVSVVLWLLGITLTFAQTELTGKVVDEDTGEGLPGVSILVQGQSKGTVTNADGQYSISVDENTILVFSFVGYTSQEIPVGSRATLDVSMAPNIATLSEIVVIGYGEIDKKDVTGAISTLGTKDFNAGVMTSPQELLMGRVAGVQVTTNDGSPGAGSTIRIRGGSSLGGATNDPLIVIDGFPVDDGNIAGLGNPLSTINPNDIESFTILKDASATAIYGSRASNGVIIITTKKGVSDKLKITYDGQLSISKPIKYVDVLNGNEYRNLIQELADEGTSGVYDMMQDRLGTANTDWQREIFRTAISHNHNVGVSGTINEVLPYRATYGYTDQQGILKSTDTKRHTFSLNLSPSLLDDHLKVNINAKAAFAKTNFGNTGAIGNAISFDPTQPIRNGNTRYKGYFQWTQTGDPEGVATTFTDNPVAAINLRDNQADVKRLTGNIQLDYKLPFFPDLRANVNLGLDKSETVGHDDMLPGSTFTLRDYGSENGRYIDYTNTTDSELLETYLNYKKDLGAHDFDATVGYSYQRWRRGSTNFDRSRDGSLVLFDNRHFTREDGEEVSTDNANENLLVSVYGRLIYSYNDKYVLTATLRQDGSSRFIGDNKFGLFPSLAFAWNINEEPFLKSVDAISDLKLRLGYGVTGQQGLTNGDLASLYYPALAQYTLGQGFSDIAIGPGGTYVQIARPEPYDANLKWEETTTYNIGADFGLWKDKLTGSLDFYTRKTTDMLNLVPVADGSNFGNFVVSNVGDMEIKGYEFTLTGRPVTTEDFSWTVSTNFMYNERKITRLSKTDDPSDPGVVTGSELAGGLGRRVQIHTVGHEPNAFYVFQQVYDTDGNPLEGVFVDRSGEGGVITSNEFNKYHKHSPNPDYLIGINSRFNYKDIDFSFSGRLSLGNYVYNNGASASLAELNAADNLFNNNIRRSALEIGFRTGGDTQYSDLYVQDASFFKMDNISAGYTFREVVKGLQARVGFTVQNAFMITDYDGLDPEVNGGIDNNLYPRPRTFLFSLNLSF